MLTKAQNYILSNISDVFFGYSLHEKVYKLAAVSLYLYIGLGVIMLIIKDQEYVKSLANIYIYVLAFTCTIGVVIEYYSKLKALFIHPLVKWFLGGITLLIYKFSQVKSDVFINEFTGIDPSLLQTASSVLTILYLPYAWIIAISAFLSVYVLIVWIFIPFEKSSSYRRILGSWKYFARFIGLIVIFFIAENTVRFFDSPQSWSTLLAKHVVISSEYFAKSHCKNLADNELSADIGRGYISIFNKNEVSFRTDICEI